MGEALTIVEQRSELLVFALQDKIVNTPCSLEYPCYF